MPTRKGMNLPIGIPILILFGMSLFYIWTVAPIEQTKDSAFWNLVLLGVGMGGLLYLKEMKIFKEFFTTESVSASMDYFNIGIILGIIGIVGVSFIMHGIVALNNLTGSIGVESLASISSLSATFTVIVQPISETIMAFLIILPLYVVLQNKTKRHPMALALLLFAIGFSAFHFARGLGYYEFGTSGILNFIFDTKGYGTADYHGGLPLLLLGMYWMILGVIYKNFYVAVGAHFANNLAAIYVGTALSAEVLGFLNILILIIAINFVFSVWQNRLKRFGDFKLSNLDELR